MGFLIHFKQLLSVFIVFLFCCYLSVRKIEFDYYLFLLLSIFTFLLFVFTLLGKNNVFFINPNSMGIYILAALPLVFITKTAQPFKYFVFFISLYLIILSGSRSVLIVISFVVLSYGFRPLLNGFTLRKVFFLFSSLIGALISIYIYIYNSDIGTSLNGISYAYTGKNLFSGRVVIWNEIFSHFTGYSYLIGNGTGMLPKYLFDTHLSAHNSYIQILLQGGVLGLIFVFLFFMYLFPNIKIKTLETSEYLFFITTISFIFVAGFEVIILQNYLSITLFMVYYFYRLNLVENVNV